MTPTERKPDPIIRAVVDYGGLVAFAAAYFLRLRLVTAAGPIGWALAVGGHGPRDITAATLWLILGSATALLVGWLVERRIAPMPLIAGGLALVFGGLTLFFHDPRIIKIKPTFSNLLFGVALLVGQALRFNPLKALIGEALPLPDEAWRKLTLRYGLFFLAMALLNEIVWRTQSDAVWMTAHTTGFMVLALLFSLTQVPLMARYMKDPEPPPPPAD